MSIFFLAGGKEPRCDDGNWLDKARANGDQTPAQNQNKRLRGKVEKLEDEIFALKRLLRAYNEEIVDLQRETAKLKKQHEDTENETRQDTSG